MKKEIATFRPFLVISRDRNHLRARDELGVGMTESARIDWAFEFTIDHGGRDAFVLDVLNNEVLMQRGKESEAVAAKRLKHEYAALIDDAIEKSKERLATITPKEIKRKPVK